MLIQFSVKNFMSFKDEVVLALNPSVDKEHPENINTKSGYEAANTIAIYGANASGKTSLFKAMTAAVNMIKNSNLIQVNQPLFSVMPFKFDKNSINEPSEFEFIFVADDGNRYVYGFSADLQKIHEEYLYQYKSKKPSMIFERKDEKYTLTVVCNFTKGNDVPVNISIPDEDKLIISNYCDAGDDKLLRPFESRMYLSI